MRREQGGLGKHLVPCDGGTYRKRRPKCMPRFGCDLSLIALVVRPWATSSLSGSSAEHSWSASIQVVDQLLPIRSAIARSQQQQALARALRPELRVARSVTTVPLPVSQSLSYALAKEP